VSALLAVGAVTGPAAAVTAGTGVIQGTVNGPGGVNTAPAHAGRFGAAAPSGVVVTDGARVSVCRADNDVCPYSGVTDSNHFYQTQPLPVGNYYVRALPSTDYNALPKTVQAPALGNGETRVINITLEVPSNIPPGTTVNATGVGAGGVSTLYWSNPFLLTTQACTGGTVTFSVVTEDGTIAQQGALTESLVTPGSYAIADPAPLFPNHGAAHITITIDCPEPDPDGTIDFDVYIDPSGVVKDTADNLLENATVKLYKAPTIGGTYTQVTNGSADMSPSNRTNPDLTDAVGHFGWDVVAGFYKVRASKPGCIDPNNVDNDYVDTAALTIPPPVTDLVLILKCVSSVTLKPARVDLAPGQQRQVRANATFTDGTTANVTSASTFAMDNPAVATVSATGLVTAGSTPDTSTTLKSTYEGIEATGPVTVSHVAAIVVKPKPVELHSGTHATQQLVAIAILDNGEYDPVTLVSTWSSSNQYRVKVTQKGYAKQNHPQVGDVTITATYDGKSGTTLIHNETPAP
jgi:hypothetical protein